MTGSTIGAAGAGSYVAVEIKRQAGLEAVEQLSRYLERLAHDPAVQPIYGCLAAQTITPQAKTLAASRGIKCVEVDYDELRGMESNRLVLF